MNITDVRLRKIPGDGKMKAVCSITIDDCFVVHDLKVIDGNSGFFIAMPSRKVGEGDFRDIAHPINSQTRQMIQKLVFEAYEQAEDPEGFIPVSSDQSSSGEDDVEQDQEQVETDEQQGSNEHLDIYSDSSFLSNF